MTLQTKLLALVAAAVSASLLAVIIPVAMGVSQLAVLAQEAGAQASAGDIQVAVETALERALVVGALALAAAMGATYLFSSHLAASIDRLSEWASRLGRGETGGDAVFLERKDEIGECARALAGVHQRETEAARIRIAFDNAATLIMLADAEQKIVFMNEPLKAMLATAEQDIRKDLPHFRADRILGANMAAFHKSPDHQQAMVQALSRSYRARISLGGRKFDLALNSVLSADGERLGTVVEWRDATAEILATEEIDAVVAAALEGDFSRRAALEGAPTMLREMGERLNKVAETVDRGVRETGRVMHAMAEGDLTQKMQGEFKGVFAELQDNVDQTAAKLSLLIAEIASTTTLVHRNAGEITSGAENLSIRAEQQASSLQQTAATMEEMSASVASNADNSVSARTLAADASRRAGEGGAVVNDAVTAMQAIESGSTKIADIVGVIDSIAFQTNLLALNAAVEAARAGDAGKGFAVVASEVRALAQRSSDAARDIRALIQTSAVQVADGVRLVSQTGGSLEGIVASIAQVEAAIQNIADASKEQAAGVGEISTTVNHMDEITQQNSSLATQSAANARALAGGAEKLRSLVDAFRFECAGEAEAAGEPAERQCDEGSPVEVAEDAAWRDAASTQVKKGSWAEF